MEYILYYIMRLRNILKIKFPLKFKGKNSDTYVVANQLR